MSSEYDDDDVWDDPEPIIRIIEENNLVEVSIDAIKQAELIELRDGMTKVMKDKLCKLNIILRNLDVYCHNNHLLVNDRYGICKEFADIAKSFGFSAEVVECGLRGKSYVIHDYLADLIKVLDPAFTIESVANKPLTSEMRSALERSRKNYPTGAELQEILRTIITKGNFSITGTQKITTTYEDDRQIEQTKGEVVSDKERITSELHRYMSSTLEKLKSANTDLQNGTVKLLHHRARQMGYAVKEERSGTQVQLVLVRAE